MKPPPSTMIVCPVMRRASSLATNATRFARSSGSPRWLIACAWIVRLKICSLVNSIVPGVATREDTGVVDQHVDVIDAAADGVEGAPHLVLVGHIAGPGFGFPALIFDERHRIRLIFNVDQRQLGPILGEAQSNGAPNTTR